MDHVDDDILNQEDDEYDGNYEIGNEEEEALLKDDYDEEKSHHHSHQQQQQHHRRHSHNHKEDHEEDEDSEERHEDDRDRGNKHREFRGNDRHEDAHEEEEEDVLELGVEDEFKDEDDKLDASCDEDNIRRREDKFLVEREPPNTISTKMVNNNSEKAWFHSKPQPTKAGAQEQGGQVPQKQNAPKPNIGMTGQNQQKDTNIKRNIPQRGDLIRRGGGGGNFRNNFQPKNNFGRPHLNNNNKIPLERRRNGTVLINPRFRGTVHLSDNAPARLSWDNNQNLSAPQPLLTQQQLLTNAIQPWSTSLAPQISPPAENLVMGLLSNLTGFNSTFQPPQTPQILQNQPQPQQQLVFEPPVHQRIIFEPPEHIRKEEERQCNVFEPPSPLEDLGQRTFLQPPPLPPLNRPPPGYLHHQYLHWNDPHQYNYTQAQYTPQPGQSYEKNARYPSGYSNQQTVSNQSKFSRPPPVLRKMYYDSSNFTRNNNQENSNIKQQYQYNNNSSVNYKNDNRVGALNEIRPPMNFNKQNNFTSTRTENFKQNQWNYNQFDNGLRQQTPQGGDDFKFLQNYQTNYRPLVTRKRTLSESSSFAVTYEVDQDKKPKFLDDQDIQSKNRETGEFQNNEYDHEPQVNVVVEVKKPSECNEDAGTEQEEDEETRQYRLKILEQKKKREEILRLKEERRLQRILQETSNKNEDPKDDGNHVAVKNHPSTVNAASRTTENFNSQKQQEQRNISAGQERENFAQPNPMSNVNSARSFDHRPNIKQRVGFQSQQFNPRLQQQQQQQPRAVPNQQNLIKIVDNDTYYQQQAPAQRFNEPVNRIVPPPQNLDVQTARVVINNNAQRNFNKPFFNNSSNSAVRNVSHSYHPPNRNINAHSSNIVLTDSSYDPPNIELRVKNNLAFNKNTQQQSPPKKQFPQQQQQQTIFNNVVVSSSANRELKQVPLMVANSNINKSGFVGGNVERTEPAKSGFMANRVVLVKGNHHSDFRNVAPTTSNLITVHTSNSSNSNIFARNQNNSGTAAGSLATRSSSSSSVPQAQFLGGNKNIKQVAITNESDSAGDASHLSSFLSNRKVLSRDPDLLQTRLVLISNLSTNTGENKLTNLARGIGEIQKLHLDKQERQATLLFKTVASAHAFYKKYRRHMLDLSMLDVSLEPMI